MTSRIQLTGLLLVAALRPGMVQAVQRCSFDTLAHSDTLSVTYSLMPELLSSTDSVDRLANLHYAQSIGEHFSAPKALTLAYLPIKHDSTPTMDDLGLGGRLQFKVDSHGRLKPPVAATTTAPELNEALAGALLLADSADALGPPPATPAFAEGLVQLRVHSTRVPPPMAVPLMRARIRVLLVDLPPRLVSMKPPKYPSGAQYSVVPRRVVLQFVVDESGRVIPSTVQVVEAQYRDFIDPAVESIQGARYEPAKIAGCSIAMLLQQEVSFKISGQEP